MKIVCVYKKRHHSYDEDWLNAFKNAGAELVEHQTKDADLTVFMHSVTAQQIEEPIFKPKGKVLMLVVNEFKLTKERIQLAHKLNATIGTQLNFDDASKVYSNFICTPHAMNTSIEFYDGYRKYDIGVRGAKYKIEDQLRNRICNPSLWHGFNCDIELGKIHRSNEWRKMLKTWRYMPSCEGGHEQGKIMTPRHFEAIASGTGLVMYDGRYNDILKPSHYITLKKDHSNLSEVKERIKDNNLTMRKQAREYLSDSHTYAHRVKDIIEWSKS